MQITAWRCDHTGQLFDNVQQYRKHLRGCARSRRIERQRRAWRDEALDAIQQVRFFRDLPQALKSIVERYYQHYGIQGNVDFNLDLWYNARVSNTHSCPRGGVQNWWQNSDNPCGYPGWGGNIRYSIDFDDDNWDCRAMRMNNLLGFLGIHTGTGGGGRSTHSYEVRLYEADFPNILDRTEEMIGSVIT